MTQFASERDVCVLLSGGIDSAACLEFFLSQQFRVQAIHVDYQQPAAKRERLAVTAISNYYEVPLRVCTWQGGHSKPVGEIVARNAFLFFAAAMECGRTNGLIATGLHSGTSYYDCCESFLSTVQRILDGYSDGRLRVVAPFLSWSKRDVWDYCVTRNVPIPLTYSCEAGSDEACGACLSCRDRRALNASDSYINHPTQVVRREP
jgi:7-cyano-7-deazaguanine synthase